MCQKKNCEFIRGIRFIHVISQYRHFTAETRKLLAKPSLHTRRTSIATIDCDCAFKYDFFGCRFFFVFWRKKASCWSLTSYKTPTVSMVTPQQKTHLFFFLFAWASDTNHSFCLLFRRKVPKLGSKDHQGSLRGLQAVPSKRINRLISLLLQ